MPSQCLKAPNHRCFSALGCVVLTCGSLVETSHVAESGFKWSGEMDVIQRQGLQGQKQGTWIHTGRRWGHLLSYEFFLLLGWEKAGTPFFLHHGIQRACCSQLGQALGRKPRMKTPDQVIRTQEREERSPRAHLGTQGCLPEAAQPPGSPL